MCALSVCVCVCVCTCRCVCVCVWVHVCVCAWMCVCMCMIVWWCVLIVENPLCWRGLPNARLWLWRAFLYLIFWSLPDFWIIWYAPVFQCISIYYLDTYAYDYLFLRISMHKYSLSRDIRTRLFVPMRMYPLSGGICIRFFVPTHMCTSSDTNAYCYLFQLIFGIHLHRNTNVCLAVKWILVPRFLIIWYVCHELDHLHIMCFSHELEYMAIMCVTNSIISISLEL